MALNAETINKYLFGLTVDGMIITNIIQSTDGDEYCLLLKSTCGSIRKRELYSYCELMHLIATGETKKQILGKIFDNQLEEILK